jgi:hypothetical protein
MCPRVFQSSETPPDVGAYKEKCRVRHQECFVCPRVFQSQIHAAASERGLSQTAAGGLALALNLPTRAIRRYAAS